MIRVPARGPTVKGLDISHYDETIDFHKVKSSGRDFCIAKATEYRADNTFNRNRAGAKNAGLLFSGYDFFHPSKDPKAQAELFLSIARPEKGELPPVLDWESSDDVPSTVDRSRAIIWLETVEHACGKPPIIYGSPYFLQALKLTAQFKRYPLWIAHYGASAPLIPPPWDTWAFWQITDTGNVPGIPAADEDLDVFNGSLDELNRLLL